jgi:hypothetical protein
MNIAAAIGTRSAISSSMPANIDKPIVVGVIRPAPSARASAAA